MTTAASLLLVEDDRALAGMLAQVLGDEGYAVTVAGDGQAGLHRGLTATYDVMVLDRRLPGIEGVDLLSRLRSRGIRTPALFLTARGTLGDRVEGLDAGAEDYLVKPFEIDELLARLRSLRRRHAEGLSYVPLGESSLDLEGRRVLRAGRAEVELSARECALLAVLAAHPQRVWTRDELVARVFSGADSSGVVDTYVHYLRRKLGRSVVATVHGLGYRMGTA